MQLNSIRVAITGWKSNISSSFTGYVVSTGSVSFILLGLSIISGILTARLLGPTGKGQIALLGLILGMSSMVGELGIGHATVYYIRKYSLNQLTATTVAMTGAISLLIVPLSVVLVYWFRDSVFPGVPYFLLVLAIVSIPLLLMRGRFQSLLQAGYRIHLVNMAKLLPPLFPLIILVSMMVGWLRPSVERLFGASLASILIGTTISGLFLRRVLQGRWSRPNMQVAREVFTYGMKSYVGNLFKFLQYRFDMFFVAYFLTPREVGFYSVAVVICEVLWRFPDSLGYVLLPKVASLKDAQSGIHLTAKLARITAAVSGVVAVVMFAVVGGLVRLMYGAAFAPSVSAIRYLLPGIVFLSVWKILHTGLIADGHAATYSQSVAISSVVMIALDIILIPRLGVNGAAIASTLAYGVAVVYVMIATTWMYGVSISEMLLVRRSDLSELWGRFVIRTRNGIIQE